MESAATDNQTGDLSAALCLTGSLMLTGLAYSSPTLLVPSGHPFHGTVSTEIINLYCLTAWMGLSHFVFAYWGQIGGFRRAHTAARRWSTYLLTLVAATIALAGLSHLIGARPFAALVWIYFIPHLIKAERLFSAAGKSAASTQGGRRFVFVFPTLAFAYFTFVLFCPVAMIEPRWKLIGTALLIVAAAWRFGIVAQLKDRETSQYALLAGFLLAEALVWGTYRQYMHPFFQVGVYVFHIALASFYHYLRAYQFALRPGSARTALTAAKIIAINLGVCLLCWAGLQVGPKLPALIPLIDIQNFSIWVALHLIASDIYRRFV